MRKVYLSRHRALSNYQRGVFFRESARFERFMDDLKLDPKYNRTLKHLVAKVDAQHPYRIEFP